MGFEIHNNIIGDGRKGQLAGAVGYAAHQMVNKSVDQTAKKVIPEAFAVGGAVGAIVGVGLSITGRATWHLIKKSQTPEIQSELNKFYKSF